jgi:hypothetical protein
MDELFEAHDRAYSQARVNEQNAIGTASEKRNAALKEATSGRQIRDANRNYNKAVRDAQSQCRRAMSQADAALVNGLSQLDQDPGRWQSPAPDPTIAAKKRQQAIKLISTQRSMRAD